MDSFDLAIAVDGAAAVAGCAWQYEIELRLRLHGAEQEFGECPLVWELRGKVGAAAQESKKLAGEYHELSHRYKTAYQEAIASQEGY